ncbi:molybdopterin cofactor-binding domain-containing protein [Croceibacterium sp. TMG7-5b_MA50]|uniref:molybdopterin cofactor-binding domain-containing protein n=1 Tax=Croceibacterium sp. TMG7-5b_MA50 TaxID=3121290 RepID=UPI003221E525
MVTRRQLIGGAAAGGGLLLAWQLLDRDHLPPLPGRDGEAVFGLWLKIDRHGIVTVAIPQLEMGQGITTLLAQIAAQELGADWRQVAVEPAPVSAGYANLPLAARWIPLRDPLVPALARSPDDALLRRWARTHRFTATAEGTSLPAYEQPLRDAAAAARALLCMAAAERWKVAWEECEAADGFVTHEGRRIGFGALADRAAELSPPDPPPLRAEPPTDPTPAGEPTAFPRLDAPAKVDGSWLFAGDVRLPGMLHAAIRHGPLDRAALGSFDRAAAANVPGIVGVVANRRWLAVVARDWWSAEAALAAMAPRFRAEDPVDSGRIAQLLDTALREGEGQEVAARGAAEASAGRPTLAHRYDIAPAAHGTVETASCTARLADGRLELWLATQAPEQARAAAAKAVGVSLGRTVLYPMPAGGSFDRRLEHEHAVEAAVIAQAVGRPVQLTWSRWQEQLRTRPRPPAAIALTARLGPDGTLASFAARIATPPAALEFGERLLENRTAWAAREAAAGRADPLACTGLLPPYRAGHALVEHVPVTLPLPAGRLRGNADGITCFAVESFMDELARAAGREPLSFRIALLGDDPRLALCLQRAARLAGWDGGAPGSRMGLACHRMQLGPASGRIALVASVAPGGGHVTRLAASVEIGRVINRDIALQQIEGGLLYGLGLALGSALSYEGGVVRQGRLRDLGLPRLAECPEIGIDLLESDGHPFDPGELPVAPVAPAIANALFAATGNRLRALPLVGSTT